MQPTTSVPNSASEYWLKSWRLMWLFLSDKVIASCLMSFPASWAIWLLQWCCEVVTNDAGSSYKEDTVTRKQTKRAVNERQKKPHRNHSEYTGSFLVSNTNILGAEKWVIPTPHKLLSSCCDLQTSKVLWSHLLSVGLNVTFPVGKTKFQHFPQAPVS